MGSGTSIGSLDRGGTRFEGGGFEVSRLTADDIDLVFDLLEFGAVRDSLGKLETMAVCPQIGGRR